MLGIHDYWLFVLTGVLLNLTPGQDTFYILGRSVAEGTKSGVASAFGIAVGSLVHTAMAALGLSAILATSASAFTVVKLLGAAYLVYLGLRMLLAKSASEPITSPVGREGTLRSFRDGVVTNVLNPKVALFFLALMPQFIAPDSDAKIAAFLVLGLTFVTTGTVWCLVLAVCAGKLRGFFARHPKGWRAVSRASGGLFVALGLRLAMARQ
ncbi:MAG TPA: LysE family translocator [Gammaproteobacteria bacterium]|nr:LysE family translocator [Gammaproteobacteria bacterium]